MVRTQLSFTRILFYMFLIVFAFLWLIPIFFMLFTALKSPADLFGSESLFSFPKRIEWSNFTEAWLAGNMSVYMKNSLFITLIKVPAGIFIAALGAFALTRLNYKWSNPTFVLILIGMMIPVQVTLVPLSMLLKLTNLIDSHLGIIIVYLGFGIPFAVLVLRGFFRTIPKELDDAARMDGCSDFGLFWRILLPIAMPAVATLVILDFLSTWNEFLLSQIFLTSNELRTIPSGLMIFKGEFGTNYGLMNAGVLISVIPILIIYLMFQKYFVQGLAGSVKG
ncbi:carbohydrate ABC transporter permease [Paenibacillus fonticola]|uniref:carbohydrate ABC transporter permease n=1 Tax=Paenibacillus fonticola TaxID=379896 RepID=UPI000375EAAC|nr:carbohydrate ABC transporter permease [Paenibacillus fonticola]